MKHSTLLASLGLCLFAFACGGNSGDAPNDGVAGASPAAGGAIGVAGAAGSVGSVAGNAGQSSRAGSSGASPMPSGGAGSGGSAGTSTGGVAGGVSGGSSQGGSSGGAGGVGQGGGAGSQNPALDPNVVPGKNFDLSRWVLQLPLSDGASVEQITDLSDYTSIYFYTGTDGAMTFWCPENGAHTPNTHYARSELRERPSGGDWAIIGTHTLTAQFKVTKITTTKGTIVGQIHGNATGGTAEILKLEWTYQNTIVASVENNTNPSEQIDHVMGSYALGELLSYTIKLQDSTLFVSVTDAKGTTKSYSTPYTASSWTNDKYYFKLGDYVQANTGGSADGARVAFYSFNVEHG